MVCKEIYGTTIENSLIFARQMLLTGALDHVEIIFIFKWN